MLSRRLGKATILSSTLSVVLAAPPGFPSNGNGLWYTEPGIFQSWEKDWMPVGNGYLAATVLGEAGQEMTQLNIESLWSGGPFADPSYNGGNKLPSDRVATAQAMQVIRQSIFESPDGTIDNVDELTTPAGAYGSYVGAGYLLSTMEVHNVTKFFRWLDLDSAVQRTSWSEGKTTFLRETFCSHPIGACVQHINTSDASVLPALTYAYSLTTDSGIPTPTVSCFDNTTLQITGMAGDPGMAFELLARVSASGNRGSTLSVTCTSLGATNATITVKGASASWVTWVGGTDYDIDAGDVGHNFSFRGVGPHDALLALLGPATAAPLDYQDLFAAHVADYSELVGRFHLDLGQTPDLSTPTDQLVSAYKTDVGNTYLEWLLFNFGRYLLASSARGMLPANLQGKWAKDSSTPWGADYHSNINIQMNYWFAELTNMDLVTPLFDYFEKTWVPRGEQTARNLYNISQGWVTHNEMNIFGHTGMKEGGASFADYPEANAWMMIHVWDHLDFTQDVDWFKAQGWPLLKSTAQFHLQKLIPDQRFNDSTLIVAPCNSPEQPHITMACGHAQQLIWQLFNAVEKGFSIAGDTDTAFLDVVRTKRAQMDKGVHIGSWSQLQEWKVDMDDPQDKHRHLSHLIGLYPGYALTNYNPHLQGTATNYTRAQVLAAAEISLIHRGDGTADSDAGWEKVWRAACWAQLQNATQFYHELSYVLERNFAPNLFSIYDPSSSDPIFQIDANFGFPAALLNGLVQMPDQASLSEVFPLTLLPALPRNWEKGSVRGARIRGGGSLDFTWENGVLTSVTIGTDLNASKRDISVIYAGKEIKRFTTNPGVTVKVL